MEDELGRDQVRPATDRLLKSASHLSQKMPRTKLCTEWKEQPDDRMSLEAQTSGPFLICRGSVLELLCKSWIWRPIINLGPHLS